MPSPFRALMRTAPGSRMASSGSVTASHLFSTGMTGCPAAPSSSSRSWVTRRCSPASGLEASQIFSRMSAVAACSNVDLKASTRWWGRRRMRPTVSMSMTVLPQGSFKARAVGSRVAKSLSSASTPAWVSWFIRVDFPALV